ncbi:DEAD/DEAH box helicase [Maribius pontilimi]|uniref:DEAD/DEAH box helicase n=1 Tax=Palleronia pontilimi TaxID=1964209 RepID=A0A934MFT8_9RHOB|nr:DEAD/DEAH box helicase [Palleronia pontilimi]MBJ3761764.1 DEAD/DEAH box helicase [Palleronia pontilimi]
MHPTLQAALAQRGYDTLTEVQQAVADPSLSDADLLVSAQTGSGKTVGFGLAIANTLLGDADALPPAAAPLALIVAPTRELALQVMREVTWLYAQAGARVVSCVGGMDMRDERRALERGAHIVVGTPGRLRDHIARGSLDLSSIRAIVLDEADEMLDLGFREDLEFMLGEAPPERRTLLFSATVPPQIARLAETYQRDATRISTVSKGSQHADITYQALRVAQSDAENAIVNVLRFHDAANAIVFANTRATVARLTARLSNRGFRVVSLSGELSQTERTHALQAMRDGRAQVCVATDVAARGIDLPNLELVIHAELPSNAEGLLHRSGRTGRAGRKGISAMIVPPKAVKKTERLLKFARITAEWTVPPGADDVLRADEARLLADPLWTDEITGDERAFAATLLDLHAPETIAAAFLRLHRRAISAPEDLSPPDTRPEPRDRAPFGPSAWIALSVGRNDRAEPRWILPLLCRAGNLDKSQIGAIRVQPSETHVELLASALPGFLSALGDGGEVEKGVTARQMDAPPERSAHSAAPARGPKPERPRRDPAPQADAAMPERKPRKPKPAKADWHPSDTPKPKPKPRFDKPAPVDPTRDGGVKPAPDTRPAKPKAKRPDAAKPASPAKTFRKGAADPSQRMERPGGKGGKPRKPGPKGKRPSGNDTPKRKPR